MPQETQEDREKAVAGSCAPAGAAPAPSEPSLPPARSCVPYAEPSYWDARYSKQPLMFDWFYGWTALRRIIRAHLPRNKQLLQVGCGNSALQEGMAHAGFKLINVDISPVVVAQMRGKHADIPALEYVVGDARDMTALFPACTFWGALEKGTIDALLCCKDGTDNVVRMCTEMARVLRPGCTFLTVTLGEPAQRLPFLCRPQYGWQVSVLLLPRLPQDDMVQVPGRALPLNDTLQPVPAIGPLKVTTDLRVEGLPEPWDPTNYFYAYACRKAPLELQEHSKVRGAVPESWRREAQQSLARLQVEMGMHPDLFSRGMRKRTMCMRTFLAQQQARQQTHELQQAQLSRSPVSQRTVPSRPGHLHLSTSQSGASTTDDSGSGSSSSLACIRRSMSADNSSCLQSTAREQATFLKAPEQQQQHRLRKQAICTEQNSKTCAGVACAAVDGGTQRASTHGYAQHEQTSTSSQLDDMLVNQMADVQLTHHGQSTCAQQE